MIIPGRVLITSILLYTIIGCIAFLFSAFFIPWIYIGICIFILILIDAVLLVLLSDRLQAEREILPSCAQNEPVKVKLFIKRADRIDLWRPILPLIILIYDLHPDSMSTNIFPYKIENLQRKLLLKLNTLIIEYTLIPNERGAWEFPGIQFLISSPLMFWKFRITHKVISSGKTYPNFKQIARGADLKGKFEQGEILKIRKRGVGMDFESLRDYQEGDSIRLIDWRATSRNRTLDGKLKLIVKNYQEEQDQQVLFIIDSGYRLPDLLFDSALNAMLLLSYVALKHGDAVAASSFGACTGASDLWIPPRKGISAYAGLMNGLYDLHSAPEASSPFLALENALSRLRRRSLIILISNFREEDDKLLSNIIPRINKKHLLLLVSFRENEAEEMAYPETPPKTNEELLQAAAALTYINNRRRMYAKWEHSGLLVLETSPKYISTALINRYLAIKKSGKL